MPTMTASFRDIGPTTQNTRLFVASKSPRRRQLLTEHGYDHQMIDARIDDGELTPGDKSTPESWVTALALLKAKAGLESWLLQNPEEQPTGERVGDADVLFLGADTVCVKDGDIIGKPSSESHCRAILERLRSGEHTVITGVALLRPTRQGEPGQRKLFHDSATVRVGHICNEKIDAYVESLDWRGKAGGYNLFDRIDAGWPIEFEGDPTAIMGLPMKLLSEML